VVNYPNSKFPFTRITEFKKLTKQKAKKTSIGIEYPGRPGFMSWPTANEENKIRLSKYNRDAERLKCDNIFFVGRLAEYKYYDMDDAVKRSLDLFEEINNKCYGYKPHK